ncbi:hypothetical protein KY314_03965, partial [Candidatus Woesearchaeota archaeon]|nr:hypothetical protein [Candidatus Woesearchaeota archaeon]
YSQYGYIEKRKNLAIKVLNLRDTAMKKGFPIRNLNLMEERINEMKRYLTRGEKKSISEEIKNANFNEDETAICHDF